MANEKICNMCGFSNSPEDVVCRTCGEVLEQSAPAEIKPVQGAPAKAAPVQRAPAAPFMQNETVRQAAGTVSYYVFCNDSQCKTKISGNDVVRFWCNGCEKEHEIDGFLWAIESENIAGDAPVAQTGCANTAQTYVQPEPVCNTITLEELGSHYRIVIDGEGGTLGRYGKYGADFFQQRGLLTVSGEHCRIAMQNGSWCLWHISKTNSTRYDGRLLENGGLVVLSPGKILCLAETVSFIVV